MHPAKVLLVVVRTPHIEGDIHSFKQNNYNLICVDSQAIINCSLIEETKNEGAFNIRIMTQL